MKRFNGKLITIISSLLLLCGLAACGNYSIEGTVTGDTVEGVEIALTGDASDSTTTDIDGDYSFTGLDNGTYTVTPSKSGYTFSPTSESVTVIDADKTGVDFKAAELIDGERFTDIGDGTVKDALTGVFWLQDANCYDVQNWDTAMSSAAGLNSGECGLTDGSVEGDWRLPTKEELQGLGTDPPATWESGYSVETWTMPDTPFVNVQFNVYWSSTEYDAEQAWREWMSNNGFTLYSLKSSSYYVWPVRSAN